MNFPESLTDRTDCTSVRIGLASPEEILRWSSGEVTRPDTINYRTHRPEKGGLFCEKVFGPEKDWECGCGKYRGQRYEGMACDRCGVKVTHSRVRRKRMGHIDLAAPVAHIWFLKVKPSALALLLDVKPSELERVVYHQDHLVHDPGPRKRGKDETVTGLKVFQVLTDELLRAARALHGTAFEAGTGAEAVGRAL